jgi:hypothetical protein
MIKLNFRKVSAIGASLLLTGMTMGVAAAANYPNPFVVGGNADVAIVYGSGEGVSALDVVEAGNIQSNLQSFMGSGSSGDSLTTSGETISLDTSSTRIWLNTSLNTAKSQLTKSDLPNVLADYTFSGNVDSKLTHTIKLVAGADTGAANSGKIIFAKQPTSSEDPVIGLSMGKSQTSTPLYNASATMSAINFTHADSEGQEVELFGQKFTVAAATDTTNLVLLKEAKRIDLDTDANPSQEVMIGEETYTVELVSASDSAATIKVINSAGVSESREINEAASKKVNGVTIAVQTADETNLKLSASVIVGAEKITITNGATITTGESADPVLGTYAYIVGGTTATTEIAVAVFRPDSNEDAILGGESFTDPLFGSFKIDFTGISSPLDDSQRESIVIENSGVKDMQMTMTDSGGDSKTFNFVHNESSQWLLADSSNYTIGTIEMANLSYGTGKTKYIVLGNEDTGHLLELYDVYNTTTGTNSVSNDRVKFRDVISGETYASSFVTTENQGTLDVDGKRYTVNFTGTGEDANVLVKYPSTDSANANTFVTYPTIETSNGVLVALYEPLTLNLTDMDGGIAAHAATTTLNLPDGDGYTSIVFTYWTDGSSANNDLWNITGQTVAMNTSATNNTEANAYKTFTVGKLTYNATTLGGANGVANATKIYVTDPEGNANIDNPGLIIFEGKGDTSSNDYQAIVVDMETAPAGTSTDGSGINDILFSSPTHWEATQNTDSDITEHLDFYGIHALVDANTASQIKVSFSIPKSQVYSNIYLGEADSAVTSSGTTTGATSLGNVLVKDSEISSVAAKNLIVVGGSCINSAAATLLGGAYCGADFTANAGAGAGEFVLKGYATSGLTSKLALLVAGYDVADTVNAATYLRTQTVDTGSNYKGTSATSAELVVVA